MATERDFPFSTSAKRTIASRKSLEACSASFLPAGALPLPNISFSNAVSASYYYFSITMDDCGVVCLVGFES